MVDRTMVSTQDISKKYNLSYQTINYYTNLGLLMVRKKKGNSRLYKAAEVNRSLNDIIKLKDKGYSLRLIRDIIRKQK